MSRLDDKTLALLSGYASGVLSAEEQRWLAQAALRDQAVFDAMADEEALRELLADQTVRERLAGLLQPAGAPWWRRPWAWAAMAAPVLAGLALLVMLPDTHRQEPQLMAKAERGSEPSFRAVEPQPPAAAPKALVRPAEIAALPPARLRDVAPVPAVAAPAAPARLEEKLAAATEAAPEAKSVSVSESVVGANEVARQNPPRVETRVSMPTALVDGTAMVPFRAEADATGRLTAKKEAVAPAVLTVQVLTRSSQGQQWTPLETDSLPAGAPLRLLVRTTQAGTLRVLPGRGNLVTLSRPAEDLPVDIDTQAAGRLDLNVTFYPSISGSPGRPADARALAASGSRALQSAMAQESMPVPVTFTRRIAVR